MTSREQNLKREDQPQTNKNLVKSSSQTNTPILIGTVSETKMKMGSAKSKNSLMKLLISISQKTTV